ncbi:MAG: hypothetical protein IIU88_06510 [Clostridia bacterium]|nr:hypothetical protein [Clostridia bacterium]
MPFTEYLILGLIAAVLLLPLVGWRTYLLCQRRKRKKEFFSKPFACPNCGEHFYASRRGLAKGLGESRAYLKCPYCGKRDICARPYDYEDNGASRR